MHAKPTSRLRVFVWVEHAASQHSRPLLHSASAATTPRVGSHVCVTRQTHDKRSAYMLLSHHSCHSSLRHQHETLLPGLQTAWRLNTMYNAAYLKFLLHYTGLVQLEPCTACDIECHSAVMTQRCRAHWCKESQARCHCGKVLLS